VGRWMVDCCDASDGEASAGSGNESTPGSTCSACEGRCLLVVLLVEVAIHWLTFGGACGCCGTTQSDILLQHAPGPTQPKAYSVGVVAARLSGLYAAAAAAAGPASAWHAMRRRQRGSGGESRADTSTALDSSLVARVLSMPGLAAPSVLSPATGPGAHSLSRLPRFYCSYSTLACDT
jgi:hypothetical protein